MAQLIPNLKQKFFDADGIPLAGGKLYSYQAGTSTPLATYQNQEETELNTNPIILDANGEADIWLGTSTYKFKLDDSDDITLWTVDMVAYIGPNSVTTQALQDGSVTTPKIADLAVTTAKLDNGVVTTAKIADLAVATGKIADGAVTSAKIAAGGVETANIAAGAVTRAKMEAVGQQLSSSSGNYSTTSLTFVDVTNLSVTITTTGRPVVLTLISSGSTEAYVSIEAVGTGISNLDNSLSLQFLRASTSISNNRLQTVGNADSGEAPRIDVPPSSFSHTDPVAAGTYTYKVQVKCNTIGFNSPVARLVNVRLLAYEL